MTKEEAIKTLKENCCAMCAYGSQDMDSCDIHSCDNKDAIKALEQKPCDDCISRKAVLNMQYRIDDSATLSTRDVVNVDDIEDLPPVTPEPKTGQWIACSDRLPEAGEYVGDVAKYYLVQNEYGDMLVARYTHSGYWEQIYQLKPISEEIVAWMPLPKSYKASPTGEESTCDDCKTPCVMYEKGMRGCISQTGVEGSE